MLSSGTDRLLHILTGLSLPLLMMIISGIGSVAIAQEVIPENSLETLEMEDEIPQLQPTDPSEMRPLNLDNSFLSIEGGKRLLEEASNAFSQENYTEAISKLKEARQVFNQLSNFYQQLASSFSGINNRIADQNRNLARETAQMRDDATYQLALVHRAQNQPELAVPLLIQIVRSQAPTRELGQKAYQQLVELGFVDEPFPQSNSDQPTTSSR
jgi:thioredoxin-like negative regulator of GroEL